MTSVLFNITDWNLFDVVQFAASFRCVSNLWSKSKSPIFDYICTKGNPPNMNPKASNWNDFYTMTDSVIICIESFIRCRLYLEMYPIQVSTLLIWFKVRLFVRKFVVRPSLSWSALIRTWFVQFTDGPCTSYLLRFCCLLRRFNIQMKVLEDV